MNIKETYRKNKDDIKGILLKEYPDFIFRKNSALQTGEIPVFVFHSVNNENLENQLKYLAENNYRSVNADYLVDILTGSKKPQEKTIALTFDDGLHSLWTVAYPLLKKYGFVGISFLIPSLISDNDKCMPNLEDSWQCKNSIESIIKIEELSPLCNWNEIKAMHNSGVIDFQSHSHFHCSVFISNKLIDFVNPTLKPSFLKSSFNPLIFNEGKETLAGHISWGFPVYKWDANLTARSRYIENEMVSNSCMEFVKNNGGLHFFDKANWRVLLKHHWESSVSVYEKVKIFQSIKEREEDIRKELIESKKLIENKLNKEVSHLCYPWYKGNKYSVNISKQVGYKSNYWGLIGRRAINNIGDDPFYIRRITEQFIFSLPGKGRKTLYKIMGNKLLSHYKN